MRCLLAILLLTAPAQAELRGRAWLDEPARWRAAVRLGQHFYDDQSIDALSEDPDGVQAVLEIDYALTPAWWVGLAYKGGGVSGRLHDTFDTSLTNNSLQALGRYRWRPWPFLVLYGVLGPTVDWFDLEIEGTDDPHLDDDAVSFGGHVGVGFELFPLHPSFFRPAASLGEDFGLGLSVEFTYDRVWPISFDDEGTALGDLDPSGPGWLMGMVLQF